MSKSTVYGVTVEEWKAAYQQGIVEFAALRWLLYRESGIVRIAFGHNGPPTDEAGSRGTPVFTHALILTEEGAVNLANSILAVVADKK
ncbi:protein of unknown function [Hyphomicrobium sp. 1Nfss2.1]|uniref:hypothetical protein n=1 Tax=Hyphomicrobium sp. 1Nfss2.1 TaxID=3413936 RepID=UPI003C7C9406